MKPLNLGSTFWYNMTAIIILCMSACVRSFGATAQLVFMGAVGVCALVLIAHSAIILIQTSSDSSRKACKVNIIYSCVFITAALIPFAAEKVLYEWAYYRVGSMQQ